MSLFVPIEIVIKIVQLVSRNRDVRSLANLYLVSRTFADVVRPLLYRDISNRITGSKWLRAGQVVRLHQTLAHHEDVRQMVRRFQPFPVYEHGHWFPPDMFRLVMRSISTLPNLDSLYLRPPPGHLPSALFLGLPCTLKSLALSAVDRIEILHIINLHPQLRTLTVILAEGDYLLQQEVLASPLITSTTLPNLEELYAPGDFIIRLLPGRRIRRLFFAHEMPQAYDDCNRLVEGLNSAGDSIEHVQLSIYTSRNLKWDLPLVLKGSRRLRELTLRLFPMDADRVFEWLGSPQATSVFRAATQLQTLEIRDLMFNPCWVEQFHEAMVHHVQSACPNLQEVFLCEERKVHGVTYTRDAGNSWSANPTTINDPEVIYGVSL